MRIEKVVVIIPTYNEAPVIKRTLHQLFQHTAAIKNKEIHILVFDSASKDNTQAIVRALQAQYAHLHLQTETKKSGLGSAYAKAMRYALESLAADIIVEMDADLSHPPACLPSMLQLIDTCDVVVGSRYIKGGSIPKDWGKHRKILSILGNYLARLVLTRKYKDFTTGFRITRKKALQKALPVAFLSSQYAYKLELFWNLHKQQANILEYPFAFIDRQQGKSKLPANGMLDSLRVLFLLRFLTIQRYGKMCFVGLSGMLLQCLIYNLLRHKLPPFNAAQFAALAAMMNNFVLHNSYTFQKEKMIANKETIKKLSLFTAYSILMIAIQALWLKAGIQYIGPGLFRENTLIVLGVILGSFVNYFIYSRFLWRRKS